jgi:hypothetical protein
MDETPKKKPRKTATPFNTAKQNQLLELVASGVFCEKACTDIDISFVTCFYATKRDPVFAAKLVEAKKNGEDIRNQRMEAALYDKAIKGHATLMIFYLMNRMPERWVDKRKREITVNTIDAMDKDKLAEMIRSRIDHDNKII